MPEKTNFTKKALERIEPPPNAARSRHYDSKVPGLALFVTRAGKKAFYLYRWHEGRPRELRIGAFPDLSVEKARAKANELNGRIAQGENPFDTARDRREEMTFGELFQEVLQRHLEPRRRASTVAEYQRQYDLFLKRWQGRKLSRISRRDVSQLHSTIGSESGPYMANRVLALVSMLYGRAAAWEHFSGENPAQGVERFRERSRDRFLQPEEVPPFFQALASEPNTTARDCLLLCLLTGARRSNVQAMRWKDINFERAAWRIPDTKTGDPLTVPLVPKAVEILQTRSEDGRDSEWVFPGRESGKHLVELKSVWARILKRANIEDLRIHDLRRSLGSWMAAKGASLTVIGKGLGHKNTATTAIYSRLNIDPVREAMEEATHALLEASGVVPGPLADGGRIDGRG